MAGFTKLFASITDSTIWCEDPETCKLWITLLAMSDGRGQIMASIPGLAARARISLEATERALERFQQPDKYSRSQEAEGRRIETIDGGWHLINYAKYREAGRSVDRREYLTRKQAERRKKVSTTVNQSQPTSTGVDQSKPISEAEAEAEDRRRDQIPPGGSRPLAPRLIAVFCEEWKAKYGPGSYHVLGKDSGAIKRLAGEWPSLAEEAWRDMCRRYLGANGLHAERRHPLWHLAGNPNEFTGAKATGPPRGFVTVGQQRTANNMAAAKAVPERHGGPNAGNGAGANGSGDDARRILSLGAIPARDSSVPRGPRGSGQP